MSARRRWPWLLATSAGAAVFDVSFAWRLGWSWALPAYLYFGVIGAMVSATDIAERRVPDQAVLPSYVVVLGLLGVASARSGRWWPLERAVLAMALLAGCYLVLGIGFPAGVGLGDVKWAGVLGLYLGWTGWASAWSGTLLAFVGAAVFVAVRRLAGRAAGVKGIPFVPFMTAGAVAAVLFAPLARAP